MKASRLLFLSTGVVSLFLISCNKNDGVGILPDDLPDIDSAVFSNPVSITNPFFGPHQGETYVFEGGVVGEAPEEEIRIELRVTTREVMGVTCVIQHDVVYKNQVVIEDTDDWLAQDDNGNLWYFGEFVKNYDDQGSFLDNDGSWEAGEDDALPGYWMPDNPIVGKKYFQEYYKDEAEDQAEVLSVQETVTVPLGTYTNCLVTKDFTMLEPDEYEKKYYAPGIGLIKEEKFINNVLAEMVQLVEIN